METVRTFFAGIILGIANVIPGVSGGTMAVVFGVYDRLIGAITLNLKKIWKDLPFLLPLLFGLVCGIILFSKAITYLYETYPVPTNFFFTGIILGSIPMIYKKAKGGGKPRISAIVSCIAAFLLMAGIAFFSADTVSNVIVTELSVPLFFRLFFAAAFAAVAMIIPGISGSFLMLVVGVYATVIAAVSDFNIPLLIPVALGVIAGLLGGAALVRVLLKHVPFQTYGAILGLVIGSVIVIFPGFPQGAGAVAISVCSCVGGAAVSFFFSRTEKTPGPGSPA